MIEKIPVFPDFRLFTLDDLTWYREYYVTNRLNPYADINPDNIFIWLGYNNDLSVSSIDDAIVLRYRNVLDGNKINFLPLGNALTDTVVDKIMAHMADTGLELQLHEVPSAICSDLDGARWLIEDDPSSFEYILDVNQQASLLGSALSHQRNRIKSFEREHRDDMIEVRFYREIDEATKKAFLNHIANERLNNDLELSQKNIYEPLAIEKSLKYASEFQKKLLVILINDRIVSFSMATYLDDHTAGGNFLKVDYAIRNIFRYTVYQLAKTLQEDGIKEINIEQDLGMEGIRSFKKHLSPSRHIKKKTIRPLHQ